MSDFEVVRKALKTTGKGQQQRDADALAALDRIEDTTHNIVAELTRLRAVAEAAQEWVTEYECEGTVNEGAAYHRFRSALDKEKP